MSDLQPNSRARTIQWQDPLSMADTVLAMPGIEYLQAMHNGTMPHSPIMQTLDYAVAAVEAGRVIFEFTPQEFHYNPVGVVHGGVVSTIADNAMAGAIQSVLPAGASCTTLELHINFVRPLTLQTGRVRVIGELLHQGRTICTAQARVLDDRDKLYNHATSTFMILYPT